MMTLNEFKVATFDSKCDVITIYSNYIMMRTDGDCNIYLYHTGNFFIEVSFSSKHKKVVNIHAFEGQNGLAPYAEKVSLVDLNLPSVI